MCTYTGSKPFKYVHKQEAVPLNKFTCSKNAVLAFQGRGISVSPLNQANKQIIMTIRQIYRSFQTTRQLDTTNKQIILNKQTNDKSQQTAGQIIIDKDNQIHIQTIGDSWTNHIWQLDKSQLTAVQIIVDNWTNHSRQLDKSQQTTGQMIVDNHGKIILDAQTNGHIITDYQTNLKLILHK